MNKHLCSGDVLIIAPHADDESIGCGGWLLRSRCAKVKRTVLICHSSEEERLVELRNALSHLQIDALWQFNFSENALLSSENILKSVNLLKSIIKEENPAYIFLPNIEDIHPDHKFTHELLKNALSDKMFEDYMPAIFQYEVFVPLAKVNCFLNISDIIEEKLSVIKCYKSQEIKYKLADVTKQLNRFRGLTTFLNSVHYAEAYFMLDKKEYIECLRNRKF